MQITTLLFNNPRRCFTSHYSTVQEPSLNQHSLLRFSPAPAPATIPDALHLPEISLTVIFGNFHFQFYIHLLFITIISKNFRLLLITNCFTFDSIIRLEFSMQASGSKSSNSGRGSFSEVCNCISVILVISYFFFVNFD